MNLSFTAEISEEDAEGVKDFMAHINKVALQGQTWSRYYDP